MTEFNDESSEAGAQSVSDSGGDAHVADPQADLFPADPAEDSGSNVDPEPEPGAEPEIRERP